VPRIFPVTPRPVPISPRRFHRLRRTLELRQPDLTVLMDRVHKGHNLSAILRNCDAVGVMEAHAVDSERRKMSLYHHRSAGTAKWIPVHRHPSAEEAIHALKEAGHQIVAGHPDPDAVDFREVDYTRPTVILVGEELRGVSPGALELVDRTVVIPMKGMALSLNVSVATSLILFEAMRQREEAGLYATSRIEGAHFEDTLFRWAYPKLAASSDELGVPYPALGPDGELLAEAVRG
jgi:tRNA (guanosine-2'-O-)-methyltransferase